MDNVELYNKVATAYNKTVKSDTHIKSLLSQVKAGNASQADISRLADRLGAAAKDAFLEYLTPDALPDNRLYMHIAEETIKPVMHNVKDTIDGAAISQLAAQDAKAGLDIAMVKSKDKSIENLLYKLVQASENGSLQAAIGTEVETTARKLYDDFQQENEELRHSLGYTSMVRREYDDRGLHGGKDVCKWCMQRVGVYKYPDEAEKAEVWARHPGCKCRISFTTTEGTEMIKNFSKKTNSDLAYERHRKEAFDEYISSAAGKDKATKEQLWRDYERKRDEYAEKYHVKKKKRVTFR